MENRHRDFLERVRDATDTSNGLFTMPDESVSLLVATRHLEPHLDCKGKFWVRITDLGRRAAARQS